MRPRYPRRLEPLPAELWDDRTRAALSPLVAPQRANPRDAGHLLATLVRHPDLSRAYLTFNAYLLTESTLSPRVREVALLRVVYRRDCDYLWSHHVPIARRAGLLDAEIDAIRDGQVPDEVDRAVVGAVDDLNDRSTVTDPIWAQLGRYFTDAQRMDLVFTVGAYYLLALAVNAFGVENEQP